MKTNARVAKSYAKALFELARERNQVDEMQAELDRIAGLMTGNSELAAVLSRPWVGAAAKRRLAEAVGQGIELSRLGRDFLALVASHGRADHLGAIAAAYRDAVDAANGRVRTRVRTARPLTESERTALAQRLGRALGDKLGRARPAEVLIEAVVDTNLLGGFVAEAGSLIVDGSLDGQLQRMRDRLTRA